MVMTLPDRQYLTGWREPLFNLGQEDVRFAESRSELQTKCLELHNSPGVRNQESPSTCGCTDSDETFYCQWSASTRTVLV